MFCLYKSSFVIVKSIILSLYSTPYLLSYPSLNQSLNPSALFALSVDGAAAVVDGEDGFCHQIHHPFTFIQAAAIVDGEDGHTLIT